MLPTALIREVDQLLKDGQLSHRNIALRTGVSRGTVNAIAKGRRGLCGKDPARVTSDDSPVPARCGSCGYRVVMPCRICLARQHQYGSK